MEGMEDFSILLCMFFLFLIYLYLFQRDIFMAPYYDGFHDEL
jgi:hypothetical protein